MSGKHNTKHYRSPSNYKQRLVARGIGRTPVMPTLESLRRRQGADGKSFDKINYTSQEAQGWTSSKKR